ncbi:binding protein [Tricladium varicosporioides]|nr:binding protein [Hymenoscyphus varicosporioides]
MAYLAPIHRPSSVRHAIKLNLLDPQEECLVLAKANRIEIWVPAPEGLVMLHSKAIYGRISMLAKIRPAGTQIDHLFIGTIRFQYFTVAWNSETQNLETVQSFEDATEKYVQDSYSQERVLVDPKGKFLVMELFQGILSLIKITKPRKGAGKNTTQYLEVPDQVRITELKVLSSCFLHTETNRPKVAFLYDAMRRGMRVATYRLINEKMEFSSFDPAKDKENDIDDLCNGASHLIPIPHGEDGEKRYIGRNTTVTKAQLGGFIVVGETKMTYVDDESNATVELFLEEASIFVAWERYDDLRYLLADEYGILHLLTINVDGAYVTGMNLGRLGKVTKATVMVYMGNDVLFIASHVGDSQIIRLHLDTFGNGRTNEEAHTETHTRTNTDSEVEPIEVLQTLANIAPVLDFVIMDMGGREGEAVTNEYSSGQARLITCSGAHEEGSLRSVRSGVGLEDVGILADMEGIREVFSLQSSDQSLDDVLVVSLPTETRIFVFDTEGEIEEVEDYRGMVLNEHTLLAMNLPGGMLLQITPTSASILGLGPSYVVANWKPPAGQMITAASANAGHLLVSANGTTLVSLDIVQGLKEVAVQNLSNGEQVACIHLPAEATSVGIVGFWKSGSISILSLNDLQIVHSEDLRRTNNASIPRDIVMVQALPRESSGPSLFVAMEEGTVLAFNVDKSNYSLSGRKSIVLGTQQAKFKALPRSNGLFNVFATCEHPSLIYGAEGRVVYSAVTAEDAICVCSFNSEAYPGSVIVATEEHLKISQIDAERRTHVRTLPMGQTIRRIAYSAKEKAFGIGCIRRQLYEGEEFITGSFQMVDDVLLQDLGKPHEFKTANGPELIECVIRAKLPVSHGDGLPAERFIVGTSFLNESMAQEKVGGRILIFALDKNKSPFLVLSRELKGACRSLAFMNGKIVAALVKTVIIYDYNETTKVSAELTKVATYRTSTCPIDLDVRGNIIAVADMMKSVSLLEFVPGEDGLDAKLNEIARHQEACWSTGVISIDDESYLETDADGNLIVLRRNSEGLTLEDKKMLDVTSEINLGEMVNKIQPIDVEPSPGAMVVPKAFLATTEGSIYLFSTILPASQELLINLQNRMAVMITTLGDLNFNDYRSFKNSVREASEPFRFVDGELLERFLDVDEEVQEEICRGLGPSVEDVRGVVEELKRLH